MSRWQKPKPTKRWQVERWLHKPSGVYLATYYDKDGHKFWAQVAHKRIEADTQKEVKQEATKLANALLASEDRWRRIIIVGVEERGHQVGYGGYSRRQSHNSPRVGFDCMRTWVLDAEDGKRYMRAWDREPEEDWARERLDNHFDVQQLSVYLDDGVEIPYSDELWEALMGFSERLGAIREELGKLIGNDDFVKLLTSGAVGLLMGGKTDD